MKESKRNAFYAIGSATADATLTAAYAGNRKAFNITGYDQIVLYTKYTPKNGQNDRDVSVSVEISPDGGTTYFPLSKGTDNVAANFDIITDMSTYTYRIPAGTGSAGATAYSNRIVIPITDAALSGKQMMARVSVKEDGGADFGTCLVIVGLAKTY